MTTLNRINIGISEEDRKQIAGGLSTLLADSYLLYLKTQNFHWNVVGPMFRTLHLEFESEYQELALAVDTIAESIRALGFPVPATFDEFQKRSSIIEPVGVPHAKEMIHQLVAGQEAILTTSRALFPIAEKARDLATVDLLTKRMQHHEKTAWMLRSMLEE